MVSAEVSLRPLPAALPSNPVMSTRGRTSSAWGYQPIRRIWILGILLVIVGGGFPTLNAQQGGDANNDGFVNSLDVPVIVDEILGLATAAGNPDCAIDGQTDVLDLICVRNHIVEFPPRAHAGLDRTVPVGAVVQLDGYLSVDLNNNISTYQWNLASRPPGSGAVLDHPTRRNPTFVADLEGEYIAELTVGDGTSFDGPDPVTVTAVVPLTTVASTSPVSGEGEVAVTRETIVRFSAPLHDTTVLTGAEVFAEFGGELLLARPHLSPDRRTITLFYGTPLPASARVRVTVVGSLLLDELGSPVDADGDGAVGGTLTFDFDTLSLATLAGTRVCGRVFASELDVSGTGSVNVPLEGVTITVDGMESELFALTDNFGDFCLDPAPAGKFFVHIDGRTATNGVPPGAYYPFVGKAWKSEPGKEVNVGDAFLPLIVDGTLQAVSQTVDTEIELPASVLTDHPEFAGTMVMVPADSLFADDGTRGGEVGIAPVPPDRLPGALPQGLDPALVITVQTNGATNFDVPAPICFPNLPDTSTGLPLDAGAQSALWSFNHDTGKWQVVGPMTVTGDGQLVCTDPGVGVIAPGWHAPQPGTGGNADAPVGPSPPPPMCPATSRWAKAKFIGNTVLRGVGCVAGLVGVGPIVECAINLLDKSFAMLVTVVDLRASVGDGTSTVNNAKAAVAVLKNEKALFEALFGCFVDGVICSKFDAALTCVSGLIDTGNDFCATLDPGPSFPSECRPGGNTKKVCDLIVVAKTVNDGFNTVKNFACNSVLNLTKAALCDALDTIDLWLSQKSAFAEGLSGGPAAADRPFTPEEIAELTALLDILVVEIEDSIAQQERMMVPVLEQYASEMVAIWQEAESLMSAELAAAGVPVERSVYYVLDIGGVQIRDRTSALGDFTRNLAPDEPFFFAEYDALSNGYGEVSSVTGSNGQVTRLPRLILDDASALASRRQRVLVG